MPLQSCFPVGRLDCLFVGFLGHAQNLVVILLSRRFRLLLRILQFLLHLESSRVDSSGCTVIGYSLFPLFQILVHFATLD